MSLYLDLLPFVGKISISSAYDDPTSSHSSKCVKNKVALWT